MSRSSTSQAKSAAGTAGTAAAGYGANAGSLYGQLQPQATSLVNSKGYDPATLAAITNAGMGATNAAFTGAEGNINRGAARRGNTAGVTGAEDTLGLEKGLAGGEEAGNIQIQNANFANQQRMAGLNLLQGLYGTNVGAQEGEQGLQNQAIGIQAQSPGWVQNFTSVLGALGGAAQTGSNVATGAK
jgi:hypothetical protein